MIESLRHSIIEMAKFESSLRFFVSILENALEKTIHKAMAQYVKQGNSKFHVI